jgi:hypothetical protein
MPQYLENALKYTPVSRQKSGLERLRMFLNAAPAVYSEEKVDEVDCHQQAKTGDVDMKEKLGGWWW